ncbi:hypothetical protein AZE42_06294 [Rhizopogon vesiculosus]|uniref:Uncharacterized protein n=1 Tax=Rhizopogon vesiculosus TaxID=180088 RepID=A0A1J8QZG7_9AGAM|nr:hypothetical protein AZE42_06294 [Rhizopogon vesiculosus]
MQAGLLVLLDRPLAAISATSLPQNDERRPSTRRCSRRVLGQTLLDLQRLSPPQVAEFSSLCTGTVVRRV